MPAKIRLSLAGPPVAHPLEYGPCLQGVVYGWIREIDSELHDLNQMKPVTVGPLRQEANGRLSFEVSALVEGLEVDLLARIAQGPPRLQLQKASGMREFEILEVAYGKTASWEELRTFRDFPPTEYEFEMETPTAHHVPGPFRRSLVLPSPEYYFGSWLHRWNLCCEQSMAPELLTVVAERVVVSSCTGGTQMLWLDGKRKFIGFVGQVKFRLLSSKDAEEVSQDTLGNLAALARFADFCGTGVETMSGMGQTRYRHGKPAKPGP